MSLTWLTAMSAPKTKESKHLPPQPAQNRCVYYLKTEIAAISPGYVFPSEKTEGTRSRLSSSGTPLLKLLQQVSNLQLYYSECSLKGGRSARIWVGKKRECWTAKTDRTDNQDDQDLDLDEATDGLGRVAQRRR